MIVGQPVAKVSTGAGGSTLSNECYDAKIGGVSFRIYDTVGLNEGEQGRVPHWKGIQGLYTLIRRLDGVSLLVYCMRGRVKENAQANWILFNKVICGEKVPIIAVVTGLEDEDDPDDWWRNKENRTTFRRYQMKPKDVACVVSFHGKRNEYRVKHDESRAKLQSLIEKYYLREPWCKEKEAWFSDIYQNVYTTGLCFIPRKRLEYTDAMRGVFTDFVKETDMEHKDYEKLEVILLNAETKMRKGGLLSST